MAIITMTDAMAAQVAAMSWGQRRFDVVSRSIFGAQALEVGAPLWAVDFSVVPVYEIGAGLWQSALLRLAGQTNLFEMWNVRRPVPLGTMRGTLTLSADAAQGASSLAIAGGAGQANTTLLQGDYLQLGSGATQQVVMVMEDASASAGGSITVAVQPPLRNAFASGAAVTWQKPKALFRQADSNTRWDYEPGITRGFSLNLVEDWRE